MGSIAQLRKRLIHVIWPRPLRSLPRTPCLGDLLGKISQARCPRQGVLGPIDSIKYLGCYYVGTRSVLGWYYVGTSLVLAWY